MLPKLDSIDELLDLPLVKRSQKILSALIGEELPQETLNAMVKMRSLSRHRLPKSMMIFMR